MAFDKKRFVRDEFGNPKSFRCDYFQSLICPVEKVMYGRAPSEWRRIFTDNGGEYIKNSEINDRYWYSRTLHFLRKIAYETGKLELPDGTLQIVNKFIPHAMKKTLDTGMQYG